MISTGALETNLFHLHSAINWDTLLPLCTFSCSAFTVDKAIFKAVWFWLPGNEWRTDKKTDGCSSYIEQDRQMAVCPFRERL